MECRSGRAPQQVGSQRERAFIAATTKKAADVDYAIRQTTQANIANGRKLNFKVGRQCHVFRVCFDTKPSPAFRLRLRAATTCLNHSFALHRFLPAISFTQFAAKRAELVSQCRIERET